MEGEGREMSEEAIVAMVCIGLPILAFIIFIVVCAIEERARLEALITLAQLATKLVDDELELRNPDEAASSRKVGRDDGGENPPLPE